ncbi:Gfo/Idh/MocA family oxidoreductase [Parvularcula sp. LCG005]|uniref:Gfo/Idh/MocA family protein n=1 Tax=Parvularcula sp. LCG005 TaxID=3078805 RepID=UPI002942A02B|nr:Gfo/Idh/MocA family oxidoreductase [Parvularcula sp. LCG005]WOI54084.1 Gfo/Idh/MocA family oxidoreductase [Parvularcula sp. LCG005]
MTKNLKAGVAGAGVFGGYHANKYIEVDGADLVAIFDVDPVRADAATKDRPATAYSDFGLFLSQIDVLTIATPASTHGDLALQAIEAGKSVLVEKPIAMELALANRLIAAAEKHNVTLQVGHQERYVAEALGLLSRGTPQSLRSRRLNKFSGRAMDVSVVFDLMIHDLDLLAQVTPLDGVVIDRIDARFEHGDKADYVDVDLRFASGLTATLSASRMEETPIRDLLLNYEEGEIGVNFLARETTNTTQTPLPFQFSDDEKPPALIDPLRYGTQCFVNAVKAGTVPPVTGADGRNALMLALMIEEAAMAQGDKS